MRSMDRVFSVDGIADQFLSSPPRAVPTEPEESSKLNRSASEWSFRRFLQEASVSDSSTSPPPPPASPSPDDRSENKESGENANQILQKQSNRNEICSSSSATSRMEKIKAAESVKIGPPCVPSDSGDYQALLKSKLNLACAAVALCRVRFYIYFLLFTFYFLLFTFSLFVIFTLKTTKFYFNNIYKYIFMCLINLKYMFF